MDHQNAIDQHHTIISQQPAATAAEPTPTNPPRLRCRHIHTDGRQCGSACLRGEPFCYFHHTSRRPIQNPRERKGRRSTFDLPLIEDRASIQQAIAGILSRIALNELDPRRAGLLLYGLQIASVNLPRLAAEPPPATTPEPPLEVIVEHPGLGPVAPEIEFKAAVRPLTALEKIQRFWEERDAQAHNAEAQNPEDQTPEGPAQPPSDTEKFPPICLGLDAAAPPPEPGTLPTILATALSGPFAIGTMPAIGVTAVPPLQMVRRRKHHVRAIKVKLLRPKLHAIRILRPRLLYFFPTLKAH